MAALPALPLLNSGAISRARALDLWPIWVQLLLQREPAAGQAQLRQFQEWIQQAAARGRDAQQGDPAAIADWRLSGITSHLRRNAQAATRVFTRAPVPNAVAYAGATQHRLAGERMWLFLSDARNEAYTKRMLLDMKRLLSASDDANARAVAARGQVERELSALAGVTPAEEIRFSDVWAQQEDADDGFYAGFELRTDEQAVNTDEWIAEEGTPATLVGSGRDYLGRRVLLLITELVLVVPAAVERCSSCPPVRLPLPDGVPGDLVYTPSEGTVALAPLPDLYPVVHLTRASREICSPPGPVLAHMARLTDLTDPADPTDPTPAAEVRFAWYRGTDRNPSPAAFLGYDPLPPHVCQREWIEAVNRWMALGTVAAGRLADTDVYRGWSLWAVAVYDPDAPIVPAGVAGVLADALAPFTRRRLLQQHLTVGALRASLLVPHTTLETRRAESRSFQLPEYPSAFARTENFPAWAYKAPGAPIAWGSAVQPDRTLYDASRTAQLSADASARYKGGSLLATSAVLAMPVRSVGTALGLQGASRAAYQRTVAPALTEGDYVQYSMASTRAPLRLSFDSLRNALGAARAGALQSVVAQLYEHCKYRLATMRTDPELADPAVDGLPFPQLPVPRADLAEVLRALLLAHAPPHYLPYLTAQLAPGEQPALQVLALEWEVVHTTTAHFVHNVLPPRRIAACEYTTEQYRALQAYAVWCQEAHPGRDWGLGTVTLVQPLAQRYLASWRAVDGRTMQAYDPSLPRSVGAGAVKGDVHPLQWTADANSDGVWERWVGQPDERRERPTLVNNAAVVLKRLRVLLDAAPEVRPQLVELLKGAGLERSDYMVGE